MGETRQTVLRAIQFTIISSTKCQAQCPSVPEPYWSPNYIQHSAHIEPGRDGLFKLIKSLPPTLKYEPGTIVADGDFVIVHGRFSNFGLPVNWIAADIVRIKDGVLVEHWDVIEDEATEEQSVSKRPMFGATFPT